MERHLQARSPVSLQKPQRLQNSLSCSEERSLWRRGEGEAGDSAEAEGERGRAERGTSVGASSLSFSKSCFQRRVLREEEWRGEASLCSAVAEGVCVCVCVCVCGIVGLDKPLRQQKVPWKRVQ